MDVYSHQGQLTNNQMLISNSYFGGFSPVLTGKALTSPKPSSQLFGLVDSPDLMLISRGQNLKGHTEVTVFCFLKVKVKLDW